MNYWAFLSPIYSGIASALLGYAIAKLKMVKKEQTAEREALGALLRHDMFQIYKLYKDEAEIPKDIQEEMHSLWQPYHALGFNHMGDKIHDEIMDKRTMV